MVRSGRCPDRAYRLHAGSAPAPSNKELSLIKSRRCIRIPSNDLTYDGTLSPYGKVKRSLRKPVVFLPNSVLTLIDTCSDENFHENLSQNTLYSTISTAIE